MSKSLVKLAALLTAASFTGSANAAVFMNFLPGTPVSSLAGYTVINTFNSTAGITGSGFQIQNVSNSQGAVIPLPDSTGTNYLTVLGGGSASIDLPQNTGAFAFEWGSLDTYNNLHVTWIGGSQDAIPGTTIPNTPADGNQLLPGTNGTFVVYGTAGELFTNITLTSRTNSFEIDNLAVKAVPEPASWALMLAGMGALGFAMRRHRRAIFRFA